MPRLALIFPFALVACTQFPELDSRVGADAGTGFPDLVPLTPLVAQAHAAGSSPEAAQQAITDMAGRIAALEARAARLRGPVIPTPIRNRMLRGVGQGALQ